MGRRIDPSWGGPIELVSFQPVLQDKGRGMCYPVCGMVHIKEPLLLIDKSSLCFRLSPASRAAWVTETHSPCPTRDTVHSDVDDYVTKLCK